MTASRVELRRVHPPRRALIQSYTGLGAGEGLVPAPVKPEATLRVEQDRSRLI